MTVRSLLKALAGLALALFVASSWATPSEAHAGHGSAAQTQQSVEPAAADFDIAVHQTTEASTERSCGGQAGEAGSGSPTCCGATCHAVISVGLGPLKAETLQAAVTPTRPAPAAVSGPLTSIKRPPRPSAALVG